MHHTINVLYRGIGLSGRTTNLLYLHYHMTPDFRGKLLSTPRNETQQISFKFCIPSLELSNKNVPIFRLYCSPGAICDPKTQYEDLLEANAIVFVVDSQKTRFEANIEALNETEKILSRQGHELNAFPWIIQYNKRDLPNVAAISELQKHLNQQNVPFFESTATQGIGVLETLCEIIRCVHPEVPGEINLPITTQPDIRKYNEML